MALTIASFCCGLRAARELVAVRAALNVRQMLPEAFVVNFIFFGMQTKPAPTKASMALFATRFGCVDTSLAIGTLRAGYVRLEALRNTPGIASGRLAQPPQLRAEH